MAFALHRHFSRKHWELIPHSSDPQRLIGIEDCSLDQITVFLARGIEAVMIALASNHTVPLPEALIYLNNISCMPRLEK
jgi:hypothetical protein